MAQTIPTILADKLSGSLTDCSAELWLPQLTADLTLSGLQRLAEVGITAENYGTLRVILKSNNAGRLIFDNLLATDEKNETVNKFPIEILPPETRRKYTAEGVEFYSAKELADNDEILICLREARRIIESFPSLFWTVCCLVKAIHMLKPEVDDYDISFSEPHIPFSIFLSAPRKYGQINALRIAEAVVHEAMHLNLTLIESLVPLVKVSTKKIYSPWKAENRPIGGLLHALYVFRVVEQFLRRLNNQTLPAVVKKYINERIININREITEVEDFSGSAALTETGSALTKRLFLMGHNQITDQWPSS